VDLPRKSPVGIPVAEALSHVPSLPQVKLQQISIDITTLQTNLPTKRQKQKHQHQQLWLPYKNLLNVQKYITPQVMDSRLEEFYSF
jgi:hypothetical protein